MIFFITGMGKSGTKFLANLLNQCKDAKVLHEPFLNENEIVNTFLNKQASLNYILNKRKPIALKNARGTKTYGEVDSYIRYHIPLLKKVFPEAKFLHLVRNGRDVVRSLYLGRSYTSSDKIAVKFNPKEGWTNESRFEKICWYWVESNKIVHEHIDKFVTLEKIVSDWDYFKENILDYLGLEMSRKTWEVMRNVRINKSRSKRKLISRKLLKQQERIFNRVCKKTMELYGY